MLYSALFKKVKSKKTSYKLKILEFFIKTLFLLHQVFICGIHILSQYANLLGLVSHLHFCIEFWLIWIEFETVKSGFYLWNICFSTITSVLKYIPSQQKFLQGQYQRHAAKASRTIIKWLQNSKIRAAKLTKI